jgi:hypothetical protein
LSIILSKTKGTVKDQKVRQKESFHRADATNLSTASEGDMFADLENETGL